MPFTPALRRPLRLFGVSFSLPCVPVLVGGAGPDFFNDIQQRTCLLPASGPSFELPEHRPPKVACYGDGFDKATLSRQRVLWTRSLGRPFAHAPSGEGFGPDTRPTSLILNGSFTSSGSIMSRVVPLTATTRAP